MISKKCQSLTPYVAGEQPRGGFVKLNTNENPYPPSPKVEAVLKGFDGQKLKLYPDPNADKLKELIAKKEGVKKENIFLGNGSDEVLGFAFLALFDGDVAFSDVTYSFYPVYCDLYGFNQVIIPLENDFSNDLAKYNDIECGGIVITNPNAPTGKSVKSNDLLSLVRTRGDVNVIVDEAYIDFATASSSLGSVASNEPNLLVVKTFSKSYSLAGLRCGYAVGNAELIAALETVKNCFNSYTLDCICQECACASVVDTAYFDEVIAKILTTRKRVVTELLKDGHTVIPSDANFIFVKNAHCNGKDVYETLKVGGVLVRHWQKERIKDYVRVTIGTDEEMDKFLLEYGKI